MSLTVFFLSAVNDKQRDDNCRFFVPGISVAPKFKKQNYDRNDDRVLTFIVINLLLFCNDCLLKLLHRIKSF